MRHDAHMFVCPNCDRELDRIQSEDGLFWSCRTCRSRAVGMGVLRRVVEKDYVNRAWKASAEGGATGRACPLCRRAMASVAPGPHDIDVCRSCQFMWFDAGEYEAAPKPVRPAKKVLPQDALESIARKHAEAIADEWRQRSGGALDLADAAALATGAMGLPLEEEQDAFQRIPWLTWSLAAVMLGVGAWGLLSAGADTQWGLLSAAPFRRGGVTIVTSFFLHPGLLNLISSVYFLFVFGDDVEDLLGHGSFGLLVLIGALSGALSFALFAADRSDPVTGSAAGVSAVVVFYGLKFPRAKLRYFRLYRWFTMPAGAAVLFWFLTQLLGRAEPFVGSGEVTPYQLLGGALVGVWFWYMWRND